MARRCITILGIFVADVAFRTPRLPGWGETLIGSGVGIGPGGKGSNQAVAAARLGGAVSFIAKIGRDAFGEMARGLYRDEGVDAGFVFESETEATGAAGIIIDAARGENAIIVVPAAGGTLSPAEIDHAGARIARSAVFMTQLELPLPAVEHGLTLARAHGVTTLLNPAPAVPISDGILALADYLTPNEAEATALTGIAIRSAADAERAAEALMRRGARNVLVTLGADGVLVKTSAIATQVPAVAVARVVDTTGAGDAFSGALAVALAEGRDVLDAARFGCAAAGLSVTRAGAALAMPRRDEVDRLMGLAAGQ